LDADGTPEQRVVLLGHSNVEELARLRVEGFLKAFEVEKVKAPCQITDTLDRGTMEAGFRLAGALGRHQA
jgi:hypothetical protein